MCRSSLGLDFMDDDCDIEGYPLPSVDDAKYTVTVYSPNSSEDSELPFHQRDALTFVFPDDVSRPVSVSIFTHYELGDMLLKSQIPPEHFRTLAASFAKRIPSNPIPPHA